MANDGSQITGRQMAAARALTGISQLELAARANISPATIKRMEGSDGPLRGKLANISLVRELLVDAGIVFARSSNVMRGVLLRTPE